MQSTQQYENDKIRQIGWGTWQGITLTDDVDGNYFGNHIINTKLGYKVNQTPCQWEGVNKQGLVIYCWQKEAARGETWEEGTETVRGSISQNWGCSGSLLKSPSSPDHHSVKQDSNRCCSGQFLTVRGNLGAFPNASVGTNILAEQLSLACTTLAPKGEEVAVIKGCIFQNRKQKKVAPRGRGWLGFEQLPSNFLLVKTATWPTETKTSASVAS